MFYCYILKSRQSNKYYVGSTKDLNERLKLHNSGLVKSTKSAIPWVVVHSEKFESLSAARSRELKIKSWKSRLAIERLFEI
ncbi:MAG: excinuclease abc c subunit domain protein [Parcubacteria group bacterium Gr01-1014_3]|nr:MAG: excinuclease abc c subunit domain protein [Parcubacteria group bacterium Gr01-1014_3]